MAKKVELPEPILPNDSWKIVELGKYVDILNGYPFDSHKFSTECNDRMPLVRIRDVLRGYTETFTDENCPDEYKLNRNDILIGMDGDFNVARWQSESGLLNQRVCKIKSTSDDLCDDFLFYYLPTPLKQINDATPSVTVKHLSSSSLHKLHFPLPPLEEQQRIVARIETLFAKLDEAKEKAQTVVDTFETRKAAILHQAFTGHLTAPWRQQHNISDDSWKNVKFKDILERIEAGKNWLAEGRAPNANEFGVVKTSAVTWGEFKENESKTCTEQSQWNEKTQIKTGDFLFSRANTLQLVGNCVIVGNISRRLMLSDKILRFHFSSTVMPDYILQYTRSKMYRTQVEAVCSGNQDGMRNISQDNLKSVELPVPSLPEQQEIVRILDTILEKETKAKEAAASVLDQIDLLKKSILARAFRGEL